MNESGDFLDILRCPETGQPLEPLSEPDLEELNGALRDGALENEAGEVIERTLEAGLVREDGAVIYPVRDGVPNLLVDDRIPVADAT